jgi:ferrous-iron efflux pump FieF
LFWAQDVEVADTEFGMAIMLTVIVLTLGLVLFQRYVVRKTGSVLIEADLLHYQSDLLMNASIILALFVSSLGYHAADAVLGAMLSVYIIKAALEIAGKGINDLMDRELPEEVAAEILSIAEGHDQVQAVHELRTRQSGSRYIMQMHIELDGSMTLNESHAIADALELKLAQRFDGADVIIHQDPVGINDVD